MPGASFVLKSQLGSAVFNFDQDTLGLEFDKEPKYLDCTTIQLDSRLLEMLVRRRSNYKGFTQAHWNQAEIGSHFLWQRMDPIFLIYIISLTSYRLPNSQFKTPIL